MDDDTGLGRSDDSPAECLLFGAFADDACARGKRVVAIPRASLAPLLFGGALPPSSPSPSCFPRPPFAVAASSCSVDGFALAAAADGGLWQRGAAWSRVEVAGLPQDERYASVAVGDSVCLALSAADGSVFQWRRRRRGEEDDEEGGDDDDGGATCVLGPRLAGDDSPLQQHRLPVTAIAAGRRHQLAVSRAAAFAWGDTSRGQCAVAPGASGHGAAGSSVPRPRAIEALGGVACALCAAGDAHSLLGSADGAAVYAFGGAAHGGRAAVPALVPESDLPADGAPVVALAAGGKHSVALRADGRVHGWGDASWGQAAFGDGGGGVRSVIAGWRHTVLVLHQSAAR